MSEKHLVCNGAICQCKFGTTPDKLKVKQTDYYINESEPSQKAIGNTMDIGQPFEANTFGTCKITKSACKPAITQWQDFYNKVTLQNGGKILLEDSKAICSVGGSPCVEISFHGQIASVSQNNTDKANADVQQQLNPIMMMQPIDSDVELNLFIIK